MADEVDKAEHQEELLRQAALRIRRKPGPEYTGLCANCEAPVEKPRRWCDEDCREDWSKREGR